MTSASAAGPSGDAVDAEVFQASAQGNEATLAFSPAALSAVIEVLRQAELDGTAMAGEGAAGNADHDTTRVTHIACSPTAPEFDSALPSTSPATVTTTDVGGVMPTSTAWERTHAAIPAPAPKTARHFAAATLQLDAGLLTIDEAASFLGVPRSWLRDRVSARQVPHTRLGRHVRFTAAHLGQIIASGEESPRATPVPTGVRHLRRS